MNQTDPTALLRDVENYLSALHGSVARHDNLAANLGCAGCELRDQIAAVLALVAPPTDRAALLAEVATALTGRRCSPESVDIVRRLVNERLCTDCQGYGQTVEDKPDGGIVRRCRGCNGKGLRRLAAEADGNRGEQPAEAPLYPARNAWTFEVCYDPDGDKWHGCGPTYDSSVFDNAHETAQDDFRHRAENDRQRRKFRMVRATTTYTVEAEHTPEADHG